MVSPIAAVESSEVPPSFVPCTPKILPSISESHRYLDSIYILKCPRPMVCQNFHLTSVFFVHVIWSCCPFQDAKPPARRPVQAPWGPMNRKVTVFVPASTAVTSPHAVPVMLYFGVPVIGPK